MRLIGVLIVAAALCGMPSFAQDGSQSEASPSILVIDREAILVQSQTGRARLAELAEAEQELAAENRSIEADLTREEASLAERRDGMEAGAFREEADAFDRRVTAIRETQDAKERVLIERRQGVLEAFRQEMLPILGEIMDERKASVMLDRGSILIFASNVDITDEVIRRLDSRSASSEQPAGPVGPTDAPGSPDRETPTEGEPSAE